MHILAVPPSVKLTANDRCDRCGAKAFTVATLPPRGELMFCGHHARKYMGPLLLQGWTLVHDKGA